MICGCTIYDYVIFCVVIPIKAFDIDFEQIFWSSLIYFGRCIYRLHITGFVSCAYHRCMVFIRFFVSSSEQYLFVETSIQKGDII